MTAPSLKLVVEDIPGAIKIAEYMKEQYDYLRRDDAVPSDYEMTVLTIGMDIMESLKEIEQ